MDEVVVDGRGSWKEEGMRLLVVVVVVVGRGRRRREVEKDCERKGRSG